MITNLRLQHFRSYNEAVFDFSPAVNIVVGPNASGKTNLLEAVLVLARGSSYRTKDTELVTFDQPWTRLDAKLKTGAERTFKLQLEPLLQKSYEIDNKAYKRLTLAHSLPVVLFEPNHLRLLSGSPEQRRNYLDDLLEQTTTGYGMLRRQYKRSLAQRNSLLKSSLTDISNQIFPWDVRLSELGGQIVHYRAALVNEIATSLPDLYQTISDTKTNVALAYQTPLSIPNYETQLLDTLERNINRDRERGFTAAGPHREDLTVLFDDRPAADTASRGEARTLVLGLKIIELQLLEAARQQSPILLLDDVFSELDASRRQALTRHLNNYQTFITTTDADSLTGHFPDTTKVITTTN